MERSNAVNEVARHVISVLALLGTPSLEELYVRVAADPCVIDKTVEDLMQMDFVSRTGRGFRLNDRGSFLWRTLQREEASLLETEALLAAFERLNTLAKQAFTRWQLRPLAGALIPNDHTDHAWDRRVVRELSVVHNMVVSLLRPVEKVLPRFRCYTMRLRTAMERTRLGDATAVAGVRVESYHDVWQELHEELLRLALQAETL